MLVRMVRKSLLRNLRITLWILGTLAMCATLVTMFVTISVDVEQKMRRSLRRLGTNAMVVSRMADESADRPGDDSPVAPPAGTGPAHAHPDWR